MKLFLIFLIFPFFVFGGEKSLHPHVHGEGKMTFVIDTEKNKISVGFEFPADQVLGFEHRPKTDAEKNEVKKAVALVAKAKNLVALFSKIGSEINCNQANSKI